MNYTPGPWHVSEDFNSDESRYSGMCSIESKDEWFIATIEDCDEWKSNAQLIAAAPDMYKALKQCVSLMVHLGGFADTVSLAYKAIEKAEGVETK